MKKVEISLVVSYGFIIFILLVEKLYMRVLKIHSLPNSKHWVDRDLIMLHACFQILQDCVEKENVDTHCNYESHKDFVDEVRLLYKWWLTRKNDDTFDNSDEDNEMLSRLMQIRLSLWT